MKACFLFPIGMMLSGISAHGQFHYTLLSTPDSAVVRVNGNVTCQTPCRIDFRWRQIADPSMAIEMTYPGYEPWTHTLSSKPQQLDLREEVVLQRPPLGAKIVPALRTVLFDRVLAEFEPSTSVGAYTHRDGTVDTLKWEGRTKVGTEAFGERFRAILSQLGIEPPAPGNTPLFSDDRKQEQPRARFTVAARVVEYDVQLREEKGAKYGADPLRGTTRMLLEWQVRDKYFDKVVLERRTEGIARYRQRIRDASSDNLTAFEESLRAFLQDSSFVTLVKEAGSVSPVRAATPSGAGFTVTATETPVFKSLSEMIGHADKACVTIITDTGHGSGVIVDPEGFVLSAYHVVEDASRVEVQFSDGLRQEARILGSDASNDVVLLDISGSGFRALPIGTSEGTSLGEEVLTIGTPAELILGQSVAKGILSGKRKVDDDVYLQTDMAVSPGNSGGPLLNMKGEVIGIIQRKLIGNGIEGLGFALPVERAMEVLNIRTGRPEDR